MMRITYFFYTDGYSNEFRTKGLLEQCMIVYNSSYSVRAHQHLQKAIPRMGPIRGDTNMEATVTTELLLPRPTAAMSPAEISNNT